MIRPKDSRVVGTVIILTLLAATADAGRVRVVGPWPDEVAESIRESRVRLAREWLGVKNHPGFNFDFTITVREQGRSGGVTSYSFPGPTGVTMSVYGPKKEILESTIPHEVFHLLMAERFQRHIPRWINEGTASLVEPKWSQDRFRPLLINRLRTGNTFAFNQLVQLTEYPPDVHGFYAQSHSVAQFVLQHGTKDDYLKFIDTGIKTSWTEANPYKNLGTLQSKWITWVAKGSPVTDQQIRQYWDGARWQQCGPGGCPPPRPAPTPTPTPTPNLPDPRIKELETQLAACKEANTKLTNDLAECRTGNLAGDQCAKDLAAANLVIKDLTAQLEAKNQELATQGNRILFFTARGREDKQSDRMAEKLYDGGFPINIITLDPSRDGVVNVPRIFIISEKRVIQGESNCITYLSLLGA